MSPQSILDNDLYKFTMQNAVAKLYPNAWVKYRFTDRSGTEYPEGFARELRNRVNKMGTMSLTEDDRASFRYQCPFIDDVYFDFLRGYRFDPNEVTIEQDGGKLSIEIEGRWYRTILWEVPLLAMVSELYHEMRNEHIDGDDDRYGNYDTRLCSYDQGKFEYLKEQGVKVADFGTRRRHSFDNHERFISTAKRFENSCFLGTSNVELAFREHIRPIGTFAHEWVSAIGALKGYPEANKNAMEDWVRVYDGELGIALTDTFGTDAFFRDFSTKYAKLFDGIRHDSGDEFAFVDKAVDHYKRVGVDPLSKTIVFSDGLNPEKVKEIEDYCQGKIKTAYGVGTNFTNDVGYNPLNIVIKLWEINGNPTVKLSDEDGKHVGDTQTINSVKYLLNYNDKREKIHV